MAHVSAGVRFVLESRIERSLFSLLADDHSPTRASAIRAVTALIEEPSGWAALRRHRPSWLSDLVGEIEDLDAEPALHASAMVALSTALAHPHSHAVAIDVIASSPHPHPYPHPRPRAPLRPDAAEAQPQAGLQCHSDTHADPPPDTTAFGTCVEPFGVEWGHFRVACLFEAIRAHITSPEPDVPVAARQLVMEMVRIQSDTLVDAGRTSSPRPFRDALQLINDELLLEPSARYANQQARMPSPRHVAHDPSQPRTGLYRSEEPARPLSFRASQASNFFFGPRPRRHECE